MAMLQVGAHMFVLHHLLLIVGMVFTFRQRIPSAQYVNVLDAKHSDVYPRAVPDAQVFAEHARRAGVNPSSHVVIYSNTERAGYFLSGRGCWTFKVSVISMI